MNQAHKKPAPWRWYAALAIEIVVFMAFVIAVVVAAGIA